MDRLCPGDVAISTAAVEMLHAQHPGRYQTEIDCNHPAIFANNPHVRRLDGPPDREIQLGYPLINEANSRPISFIEAYVRQLGRTLGIPLECKTNRPHLYLTEAEKCWPVDIPGFPRRPGRYSLVVSGTKADFTTKGYGRHNYQQVVNMTKHLVTWVQVGHSSDNHPPLEGVINLVGATDNDLRKLIRLCYHAQFGLGPVTAVQAFMAAFGRPYICLLGGRENLSWQGYAPTQITKSSHGLLPCCARGSCWKNKTIPIPGDNDKSLCELPVLVDEECVPACLNLHRPEDIARDINTLYASGTISRKEPVLKPDDPVSIPDRIIPDDPTIGLVIGTYGSVPYINLHLEAARRLCPGLPILVNDDSSDRWQDLNDLCRQYGAEYISNPYHLGHKNGDLSAFASGLLWAKRKGLDLLVKMSRRWICLFDWRPGLKELAVATQFATYSNICHAYGFGFRTECIGLHVDSWYPALGPAKDHLRTNHDIGLPEAFVHQHLCEPIHRGTACKACRDWCEREHHQRTFGVWQILGTNRNERQPGVLWHNNTSVGDYAARAAAWGLPYTEANFSDVNGG